MTFFTTSKAYVTFCSLLALLVTIPLLGFGGSINQTSQPNPHPQHDPVTLLSPPKPLIDFSLTDTTNNTFNNASLLGTWTVLFFGYSECPEICPRTLAMVSEVWRSFPNHTPHPKAQFVFVSLNSGSDSSEKLKAFLQNFNPTFIGLRGPDAEVDKLAKACRIYQWTDPKLDAKGNKIIDHSAHLLLINPEGKLVALFSPPHAPELIAQELSKLMLPY